MSTDINQIIIDFNNTLETLILTINTICPIVIHGNKIKNKDITDAFHNKMNFEKFIDFFSLKVLPYKNNIHEFFTTTTTEEGIDKYMMEMISLKSVWPKLDDSNKETALIYIKILCDLAQMYYDYVVTNLSNNFN